MAIKEGLQALVDRQLCRVIIETDLSQSINLLHGYPEESHPHLRSILECKRLHTRVWSSPINYISRSCNVCAHTLARLGRNFCNQPGTFWFDVIPPLH